MSKQFKRKTFWLLFSTLIMLIIYMFISHLIEKTLNFEIPSYVGTALVLLLMMFMVIVFYKDDIAEVSVAGLKLRDTQKQADEMLVKYIEFKKSVEAFIEFNLAVLEKDGTFDNITSSLAISHFLHSVKNISSEMNINSVDVVKMRAVGKIKLMQAYKYEIFTRFRLDVNKFFDIGAPEYVGGSFDISKININYDGLYQLVDEVQSNEKDEFRQLLDRMRNDEREL